MPYRYEDERSRIVATEEGQDMVLAVLDKARSIIPKSGAATMGNLMCCCGAADSWMMLASVDRLVETGHLIEAKKTGHTWGQNRIFGPGPRL